MEGGRKRERGAGGGGRGRKGVGETDRQWPIKTKTFIETHIELFD